MKPKFVKSNIKLYLLLLILFLIIAIIIILFGREENLQNKEFNFNDDMKIVDDYNTFFFVNTNINNFISKIGNQNGEDVIKLLDNNYVKDNNITINNVLDKFSYYGNNMSFSSKHMYYREVDNNYIYYVSGEIFVEQLDLIEVKDDNFQILLLVDYNNFTMSVIPITSDDELSKYILNTKNIVIEKNEFNAIIPGGSVSNMMICSLYLSNFLNMLYKNVDESYNLLSNDTKLEFSNIDNYKTFINDNLSKLSYDIDKCIVDESNIRKYYINDVNGNEYIFTEISIMNYNVDIILNDSNE